MDPKNKKHPKKNTSIVQERPVAKPKPWAIIISVLLIVLVGILAYANSFHGQFVYDDPIWIQQNHSVVANESLQQIFSNNIGAGSDRKYNFYRPLTILSLAINYHWAQLNVVVYHATNLAFHIGVALCIYWLINILFAQNLLALLTAVFYVAHPIHTEAVCYISGRSDSMYVFFLLLSFIFYLKEIRPAIIGILLVIICYALAICSKENAIILPFLVLVYHGFFGKFKPAKFTSLVLITLAYGILRATLLYFPSAVGVHSTFSQRVPGFFVAITNYARLLIWPSHLHMEYGDFLFGWDNPEAIGGLLIFAAAIACAVKMAKTNRLISFAIAWFFVALMPESNLYQINAYMYEHWLYLPSVGFFLVLAYYLSKAYHQPQLKVLAVVVMIGLTFFYAYLTFKQSDYWKDPIGFYERTLKYAPFSARLDNNLALLYSDSGDKSKAVALFQKAISLNPQYAEADNNLAVVYADLGKNDKAIEYYQKTLSLANTAEINFAGVYSNLGAVYAKVGQSDEADAAYQKAIELNPNLASSYNNWALLDQHLGKQEEARELLEKAVKLDGQNPLIRFNLANTYVALKRNDDALEQFKTVTQLDSSNGAAFNNIGFLLKLMGRDEEAIPYLSKALDLNPRLTQAYENLSLIYLKLGEKEMAQSIIGQALANDPSHADQYNHVLAFITSK